MNYLYYSLYIFYTKIIQVQKDYPPVINIAGVLALVQMSALFAIINTIIYIDRGRQILLPYGVWLPFSIALVFYYLNEQYYRQKEKEILERIGSMKLPMKVSIIIISFCLMAFIIWLWMEEGLYKITCHLLEITPVLF